MKKSVKRMSRAMALLMATVMLIASVGMSAGCAQKTNVNDSTLMTIGNRKIGVWFYEFLLSRMKAELARSKYDVKSNSFWQEDCGDGRTWQQVCEDSVLDSVKLYAAGLKLFDDNGLVLSSDYDDSIKEDIDFYIDYDADNSKDAFNEILEPFGVDVDTLTTAYKYEYMVALVQAYLYGTDGGLVGKEVKEEYFKENYYCFKQILFPTYYYQYVTDESGNTVYFDSETGYIAYDKENGELHYDSTGAAVTDGNGQKIYYGQDGNPIYDTVNGTTQYISGDDGAAKPFYYDDEEAAQIKENAQNVMGAIGSELDFEYQMQLNDKATEGRETYANGYYLSDLESANFTDEYLNDILAWLKTANVGDIKMFESSYGYHIVMKINVTEGDYDNEDYELMFSNFTTNLTTELYTEKCRKMFDSITLNDEALKSARSIVEIGINYNY